LIALGVIGVGCHRVPVDAGPHIPPAPRGTEPAHVVLTAQHPTDADRNGFPDTVGVYAYLFPPEGEYSLPIFSHGTLRFELDDAETGEAAASWSFSAAQVDNARSRTGVGPCYVFSLSLKDAGMNDEFATRVFALRAWFEPSSGKPAATGRIELRLGSERKR